jgi:rare lipoprotein A
MQRLEPRSDMLSLSVAPHAPIPSFSNAAPAGALDLRAGAPKSTVGPTPLAASGTPEPLTARKVAPVAVAPFAGPPYQVAGRWYVPAHEPNYNEVGTASWYGPTFHGKRTANGEIYDQHELTAAHRTLQMPSLVRVTNLENGRSIVVRINDRGPFKRGRVIDVSKRAAELLGFINQGTARVRLEVLEKESRKIAAAARGGMDTSRITLADLNRLPDSPVTASAAPVMQDIPRLQQASLDTGSLAAGAPGPRFVTASGDPMLPESLRTPTITVEEINRTAGAATTYTPSDATRRNIAHATAPQPEFSGHVDDKGRFMPDAVVQTEPVVPTGLFIQAGSFSVRENADRMSRDMAGIAPAHIETVTVNGRQFFRVKLGPFADLTEADAALARMASAGNSGGRVVRAQ